MFERYTERARRVIFFARYEASAFGSTTIETEHLLLGLVREDRNVLTRFLPQSAHIQNIRTEIEKRSTIREKISTSVDLPLSNECKRILAYAAEEAERLAIRHIGVEHLLLGILREEKGMAAEILRQFGFALNAIREELARHPMHGEASVPLRPAFDVHNPSLPANGVVPDADTAMRIAEAVWIALYGIDAVRSEIPFIAELRFNVWLVTGTAAAEPAPGDQALFAYILQADGRILSVGRGPVPISH